MNTLSIALLALGTTACIGRDDRFDHVEQAGINKCEAYVCGNGNSDVIDNMGLHDLNVDGLANSTGFTLTKLVHDGHVYKPRVYASELYAMDGHGNIAVSPKNIVGAVLVVENAQTGTTYWIKIKSYSESEYWATKSGSTQWATSYELQWTESGNDKWTNVCITPPPAGSADLRGGQPAFNAFLFEGDRIDAKTKKFADHIDDSWFNIGCMGHAFAKLHLTGHTEAARRHRGILSETKQRQTLLKMIVGDYCRNGDPYTVAGQALDYMNSSSTLAYASVGNLKVESRWDVEGATCLNTPRTDANPTPASLDAFPDGVLRAMDMNGCTPPPPCTGDAEDELNLDGHYLNSANPY